MEKIKQALEEARRKRERMGIPPGVSVSPADIVRQLDSRTVNTIRRLVPINELPEKHQDYVITSGEIVEVARNERIFSEGSTDQYVHYLLSGTIVFLVNGQHVKRLSGDSGLSSFPLDDPPNERKSTVVALHPTTLFRISYKTLQRELHLVNTSPPPAPPEVMDISEADSTDWLVVNLRNGLFANLPADTIQRVLASVSEHSMSAGDVIINQGDPPDGFYLLKSGLAEVRRRTSDGVAIHLSDIGPGSGFGEEALITGEGRNATVRMKSDGVILKLRPGDFDRLIREPLLQKVSLGEAESLVDEGACWIDARYPELFRRRSLPGAINLPLPLLRLQYEKLDVERTYIIYSDNVGTSAVAAFLLAARGRDTRYVDQAVILSYPGQEVDVPGAAPAVTEPVPATPPASQAQDDEQLPVAREFYADTQSGIRLADLVDEINAKNNDIHHEASHMQDPATAEDTLAPTSPLDETAFRIDLDIFKPEPELDQTGSIASVVADAHVEDPVDAALAELGRVIRTQIATERQRERERMQAYLNSRVERMQSRAREIIQQRLKEARARDREIMRQNEDKLREHYDKLRQLANRVTHQKAELKRARQQLEEKLRAAEALQRELAQLGQTMTRELADLDDNGQDDLEISLIGEQG
ncbi:MAG: cyclic nucleotide-binding domain-containing protein [Gammaproteobacteria bacterium]|nr:cyclic nucleotide-binding domain-containing protein [Gammaproteobacteria bacterium]